MLSVVPWDFFGQDTFDKIVKNGDKTLQSQSTQSSQASQAYIRTLEKNLYSKLKLRPEIQAKIDKFVHDNRISDGIAVHVRRTDFLTDSNRKSEVKPNETWFDFIDKSIVKMGKDTPVYLATDNEITQREFVTKYPNIIMWKTIGKTKKLRKTSLEDAVIDVYIARHAKVFLGTQNSSYSDLIELLTKNT